METIDPKSATVLAACDAYVARLPVVTHDLPSGTRVAFRRPGPLEWVAIWDNVPTLQKIESHKSMTEEQTLDLWSKMKRTLMTFAVSPRIVDKDYLDCEPDELSIRVITSDDLVSFLNAIVDSIGVSSSAAQAAGESLGR